MVGIPPKPVLPLGFVTLPSEIKTRICQFVRNDDPDASHHERVDLRSLRLVNSRWNAIVEPLLFEHHLHRNIIPSAGETLFWAKWAQYMRSGSFLLGLPTALIRAENSDLDNLDIRTSKFIQSCSKLVRIHVAYYTMYLQTRTLSERLPLSIESIITSHSHSITELTLKANCDDGNALAAKLLDELPQIKVFSFEASPPEIGLPRQGPQNAEAQLTQALFKAVNLEDVDISGPCLDDNVAHSPPKSSLITLTTSLQFGSSNAAGALAYYSRTSLTSLTADVESIIHAKMVGNGILFMPRLQQLNLVIGFMPVTAIEVPHAPELRKLALISPGDSSSMLRAAIQSLSSPKLEKVHLHTSSRSEGVSELFAICQSLGVTFEVSGGGEGLEDEDSE